MPQSRYATARVKLDGRSWHASDEAVYCFDALVDGEPAELRQVLDEYMSGGAARSERVSPIAIAAPHVSPYGGIDSYRAAYSSLQPSDASPRPRTEHQP